MLDRLDLDSDIDVAEYESDEVNGIYFAAVFIVLIVWAWAMKYQADIGVLSGLIGVSGVYLFMLRTVQVLSKTLLNRDISESLTLKDSIFKEVLISFALMFIATMTLFAWGSYTHFVPTIAEIINFFIAYISGVFIKFGMIKFTRFPLVGILLAGIFLILLGFIFNAHLFG